MSFALKPVAIGILSISALCVPASAERARSADQFVDSMGVCTHWSYSDTTYGTHYAQARQLLAALGIRHIRDSVSDRTADLARFGIRTTAVVEPDMGSPEALRDRVRALNRRGIVVDAVEGPNEPDIFWPMNKKTYKGQGFPEGTIAFQKDLYVAFKGDSATKNIPVFGPALGVTYDPGGGSPNALKPASLRDSVDRGNFHPYPHSGNTFSLPFAYGGLEKFYWQGNFPSVNLDEFPFAFNTYSTPFGGKPMVATETGYSTERNGASETAQAKYIPRLYAEYFRLGIRRAYVYEFLDEFPDPDNREGHFGLVRRDLTPKPAYTALKSLIALLIDRKSSARFAPGALDFAISVKPLPGWDRTRQVHHLLLKKSDGDFYLLLWHEVSAEDISTRPHRQLAPPAMPVTISLKAPARRVDVYSFDSAWNLVSRKVTMKGGAVSLSVPDVVTVLRLSKRAG